MLFYPLILSFVFIYIAFMTGGSTEANIPAFLAYFYSESQFIISYYKLFIFGFVVLTLAVFFFKYKKEYSFANNVNYCALRISTILITGFLAAYIFLYILAFVQLNILALLVNIDPKMIGIQVDKKEIVNTLKEEHKPPNLVYVNKREKALSRVASAMSGTENFYGGYILPSIPGGLILPIRNLDSSMFLIADTLVVTDLKSSDMQAVSSIVGYLFVKGYFPTRNIKFFPKVTIMNGKEYRAYRKADAAKKLAKIDGQIVKLEGLVSSVSATMKNDKNKENEERYQELLDTYKYYVNFYKLQKKRGETLVENIPFELGFFFPSDSIKIMMDKIGNKLPTFDDYYSALVHEYFHYASYVLEKKHLTGSFFEEGFTEYFTREAIRDNLKKRSMVSYPAQVAIITEMMKMITEGEFAEIYFTKDEEGLESALDRVYGDGFYKKNQVLFETLPYTNNRKQILKLTNAIMKQIGGPKLKEEELFRGKNNQIGTRN